MLVIHQKDGETGHLLQKEASRDRQDDDCMVGSSTQKLHPSSGLRNYLETALEFNEVLKSKFLEYDSDILH